MTRAGSALLRSILLTATTIGTSAALAWLIASTVWGITPSSAATTSTTMSVTSAPASAHLRERLVAGCVDERDQAPVLLGLVGADVLCDAAGLARDDVRRADAVEQQRLAVVDMAHHGDDRRACALRVGIVVIVVVEQLLELELLLLSGFDEQEVRADLEREQLHLLVGERHGRGDHRPLLQQVAHDVGGSAIQLGSELLRTRAALDHDGALGHRRVGRRVRR